MGLTGKNMLFRTRTGEVATGDPDKTSYVESEILTMVGTGAGRKYITHECAFHEEESSGLEFKEERPPLTPTQVEKIVDNLIHRGYLTAG